MLRSSSRTLRRLPNLFTTVPKRCLPACAVETNLKKSDIPTDFALGLTKVLARALNKPEQVGLYELSDCMSTVQYSLLLGAFKYKRNRANLKPRMEFACCAATAAAAAIG